MFHLKPQFRSSLFVVGLFLFIQQAFAGSQETDSGWTWMCAFSRR